jgi:hypothetical protein
MIILLPNFIIDFIKCVEFQVIHLVIRLIYLGNFERRYEIRPHFGTFCS